MDTLETIMTRRSIRAYTDQPVPAELVQKLLAAAMQAPSGNNSQPWHFVVVRERATLNAMAELITHGKMLTHAPLAVVVCGSMAGLSVPESWVIACSAATENLLLAAHASGLGAVWLGVYPRPERVAGLKTLLGLPEEITPLDAVALGWPAEAKERADRFKPDRIHYEQW